MVGEGGHCARQARTASSVADAFASNAALLGGEGESDESGGPERGFRRPKVVELGGAELEGDVSEEERVTVSSRVAEFAREHEEKEGNPHEVDEGEGLRRVETRIEPVGEVVSTG